MFFTVQLILALIPLFVIAFGVSIAGSVLRLGVDLCRRRTHRTQGQFLSWEGLIVGSVVVGLWLCRPTRDVYLKPLWGPERLEFRQPSLWEAPFGLHLCSDVFVPVNVDYIDAEGRRYGQFGCEGKPVNASARIADRTILWSSSEPSRVIVILPETGMCFFFPDPINDGYCPEDAVVNAYLRGDPVASVKAMID